MKTKNNSLCFLSTLLIFLVLFNGCKDDDAPLLTTISVTNYAITTAVSGGTITSDGGASVTARGVCWSLKEMPTTSDFKTSDGTGTGSFTSNMTGLMANTKYFVRAYAINTAGTAYGSEVNFTTYGLQDIDGNGYHSVKIGKQEWMQENLKVTKYRDDSAIPNIQKADEWINLSIGAYCDYDNAPSNVAVYGRLYNYYAVADQRKVCPSGWHVPTIDEGNILINALGGEDIAGGKMKSKGILQNGDGLWNAPNTNGTNESEFTGLPAGTRFDAGDFRDLHNFGHWRTIDGWSFRLRNNHGMVEKFYFYPTNGTSIRCVKD